MTILSQAIYNKNVFYIQKYILFDTMTNNENIYKLIKYNHYIQNKVQLLHNIIIPYFKIVYVKKGVCDVIINNRHCIANDNDIFVIPPYTIHNARFLNNDLLDTFEIIFDTNSIVEDRNILERLNDNTIFINTFNRELLDLCHKIDKYEDLNNDLAQLDIFYLISKTILMCQNTLVKAKPHKIVHNNRYIIIDNMLKLLDENIIKYGNPKAICDELNISSNYLYKLSKEFLHDNPSNFIIKYKIIKSYKLLFDSSLSIEQIAYMLGYKNQFYFSKQIKKFSVITPSKFRKL